MQSYGPAVLRLAVGATFVAHGLQKLLPALGGAGLDGTAQYLSGLGLSPAYPLAAALIATELLGGLLLILGAFTTFACAALLVEMIVAIWKVHYVHGFFINWTLTPGVGHGFELNLLLIAALGCLMLTGPGAFSVDGGRARSAEAEAAGRARLRAGQV